MRRLSIHRPNAKLRNPDRHIRALEKWASGFQGYYPERTSERYINFKIWTLDRLVEGPKAKHEWKQKALKQLIVVAKNLIAAKPENEKGKSWVAILLCYPNLWSSEVTVFFDKEYYESFQPREGLLSGSINKRYGIELPPELMELGYDVCWEDEDENGEVYTHSEERWTLGEKTL
jgi:hypothetical protein